MIRCFFPNIYFAVIKIGQKKKHCDVVQAYIFTVEFLFECYVEFEGYFFLTFFEMIFFWLIKKKIYSIKIRTFVLLTKYLNFSAL